MEDKNFSFEKIPNWLIISFMVFSFVIYILFFDKNFGYSAVMEQKAKNDTLMFQCNELRKKIEIDSLALESIYDSAKFEHYLREKRLFIGEGETMYQIYE